MTCDELAEEVTAFLDCELGADESARIDVHLTQCPTCAGTVRSFAKVQSLVGQVLARAPVARGVSEEAFERLWEFARFQDKMPPQQHTAHARHGRHPSAHDSPSYAFGERRVRSWYGAAGLAIAACLALVFYSLFTYGPATSAKQNAQRLTEQARSSDSRVAARASRNTGDAGDVIARASRRAAPEQGQEAQEAQEAKVRTARADSTEGTRIADGDLPVPDELRTRAGLFVDYGIVRRLDKLRHLDAILAQPNEAPGGTTSDADSGGHG